MKIIVLLSIIALSFGTVTQLEMAEADLLNNVLNNGTNPIATFMEYLGQVTNQTEFVSDLETVWNETAAGQRNDTNFSNLIQATTRIFGENVAVVLQDFLQMTYYQKANASLVTATLQKTFEDLSLFLFPGSDSMDSFLRDFFHTVIDWIVSQRLNLTDGQQILEDVLNSLNVNASDYQTEIQEVVQVIYNHFLAPANFTYVDTPYNIPYADKIHVTPPSNADIFELINSLAQTFSNDTNPEDVVIQEALQIFNQSVNGQLNFTLIKTLISDLSNLLIEDFVGDEDVIQDAMQTLDDIVNLTTSNTSIIENFITNPLDSLLNTYASFQSLNASAFSANSIISSAQSLLQASASLIGNATVPDSMISETLEIINQILSSDHFNITDLIPLIEDAFELVGNDTEFGGVIQGLVEILNDIASGQPINVADLAEDIEEAFADIAFGNSSYFSDAIQDFILIIQGQDNSTTILNFVLNTAQILVNVTDYSGPLEQGISIIEDITSGNKDYFNIVENGLELVGELTGYGDIIQDVLKILNAVTSGSPISFLEGLVGVIEDITGIASIGNIIEDAEMIDDSVQVLDILSSANFSSSNLQILGKIGLEIFGRVTNTEDLASDLIQAAQDLSPDNAENNFDLIVEDGANIAHDLENLGVVAQNQGNMKTITEDSLQMLGIVDPRASFVVDDFVNVFNSFTSGNITKETLIENIITIIEDSVEMAENSDFNPTEYQMHSLMENVFQIINGYTSGQLTDIGLLENIAIIFGDIVMMGIDNDIINYIPLQDIVQVIRDYYANDMQSLVEDIIDLLADVNVINSSGLVLSKSVATTIAIDQYAANSSQ